MTLASVRVGIPIPEFDEETTAYGLVFTASKGIAQKAGARVVSPTMTFTPQKRV